MKHNSGLGATTKDGTGHVSRKKQPPRSKTISGSSASRYDKITRGSPKTNMAAMKRL
jgi:hypothetical protein